MDERRAIVDAMMAEGRGREVLAFLLAETERNPRDAEAAYLLALALADQGRPAEALTAVQRARRLDPSRSAFAITEAEVMAELGNGAGALSVLADVLKRDSEYKWAVLMRAEILLREGEVESAEEQVSDALEFNPPTEYRSEWVSRLNQTGIAFMDQRRDAMAERLLLRAIALDPSAAAPYTNLGILYGDAGRPLEGVIMLVRAMDRNPKDPVILYNLGRGLWGSEGAEAAFRRVVEIDPNYPDVYRNLAEIYQDQSRPEEADQMYQQAITRYGDALSYAEYADFLYEQERLEQAEANAQHALAVDPCLALAHEVLGHVATDRDEIRQARLYFAEAARLEPDRWDAQYDLAASCAALEDKPAAMEALEKALSIDRVYTRESFQEDERWDSLRDDVDIQALIYAAGLLAAMDEEERRREKE